MLWTLGFEDYEVDDFILGWQGYGGALPNGILAVAVPDCPVEGITMAAKFTGAVDMGNTKPMAWLEPGDLGSDFIDILTLSRNDADTARLPLGAALIANGPSSPQFASSMVVSPNGDIRTTAAPGDLSAPTAQADWSAALVDGDWVWGRTRIEGGVVKMKAWMAGANEPPEFLLQQSIAALGVGAGKVGLALDVDPGGSLAMMGVSDDAAAPVTVTALTNGILGPPPVFRDPLDRTATLPVPANDVVPERRSATAAVPNPATVPAQRASTAPAPGDPVFWNAPPVGAGYNAGTPVEPPAGSIFWMEDGERVEE